MGTSLEVQNYSVPGHADWNAIIFHTASWEKLGHVPIGNVCIDPLSSGMVWLETETTWAISVFADCATKGLVDSLELVE